MNVLIIDDERAIRRALREILEFENCCVEEAEDGKQGLTLSQNKVKAYSVGDISICYANPEKANHELKWNTKYDDREMSLSSWIFSKDL